MIWLLSEKKYHFRSGNTVNNYFFTSSDRDFVELSKSIQYEGPTLIVVRTTNDTILGIETFIIYFFGRGYTV